MAYVPVPKDLTRVKTKFLFNLTKRQVFCFGLGALVCVPLFFVTKDTMGSSMAALIMIAAMMPFFMFAMYEKNGQPLKDHPQYRAGQLYPPEGAAIQNQQLLFCRSAAGKTG